MRDIDVSLPTGRASGHERGHSGVPAGQCLDRHLPDRETLEQEVTAWVATRNAAVRIITWRFTTDDARIKLDHLYPMFHD